MDLLERFARGDLEAFELLFRQFHRDVYGWLVRLTRNPAAAEDLTVEVFWRIYRAHARFDPSRSFGAWARRIASNAALDYLRRARREPTRRSSKLRGRSTRLRSAI
jgi:RNA polymerase sigma-70 factor (ECF subfamily)